MWSLVISLALKFVLPLVVSHLEKEGFPEAAEALAIKGAVGIVKAVKSAKIEQSFPSEDQKGQGLKNGR